MSLATEKDQLLGARQAASYAGKHINTIRRWIKKGYLPDRRVMPAGRYYLISKADLDAAMQSPSQTEDIDDAKQETP